MITQELENILPKDNLLEVEGRLITKIENKPFNMANKNTYEPLLELLEILFIREYPNFEYCVKIGQLFLENEVTSIHSNYRYFREVALWYLSFVDSKENKEKVYTILTDKGDAVLREKRITRICKEEHVEAALNKYKQSKDDLDYFYYGTGVISKSLQVLVHVNKNTEQGQRLIALIKQTIQDVKEVLPRLKAV
ncbi:hypothetical protein ACYSNM_10830 [Myroides sp. LJL116]